VAGDIGEMEHSPKVSHERRAAAYRQALDHLRRAAEDLRGVVIEPAGG
jgi:hypothetical protein